MPCCLPLLQALGFALCLQACKANGHALLAKSGEKRGGGAATMFHNILRPTKVPNATTWKELLKF